MTARKLLIAQNVNAAYVEKVQEVIPEWTIVTGKDKEIWQKEAPDAEVIAGWKKGMEDYTLDSENSSLKWVQTWSAGVNSLPLDKLSSKNVLLTSANGVHAFPISETIFALMLGMTRKIHTYVRNQQSKTWDHSNLKLEIHGKTIGILGTGAIGKETAKIAKAFGMRVLGMRHSGKPEEYIDKMYTSDKLHDLLPECDYVAVTLPLTEKTHHLLGQKAFQLMKKSAFFINIGRGDIVVEEEMIEALKSGEIAGAGLDVFETEPLGDNSPLWEMENVIITPHTAGSTQYYDQRVIEDILIPNLKEYVNGKTPSINAVDYKKGY
ncbi:D-2-hydroxyacid dehydrogenase [Fictibacillus sp. KU28468]|uniref:D-2-hydroxyacid dehydrogenase n=1 Tax=Fictibacillus sp. KU28468 TaxID=2991053 RepID=UPI00223D8ED7|nr:D-2-hydroxyacid dehydrogenase [Fictibacillus sp. KU28468]UZJ79623.1 D-2-hydroxyacid dehydrogenase [Fictibacillus sp. KU28468]